MSSSCRKLYVALGAGALLGAGTSSAANWEYLPRIEVGGTFNDNYRMAEGSAPKLRVYGPYLDAQLSLDLLSQTSKLDIVPRVHSTYFPTDHADQSTNGYLDILGEHRTLRSDLTGIAQYADETVFYSELPRATFPGVALGEPTPGVSGRVNIANRRRFARLAPKFDYDMTERAHLNLNADLQHVSFGKSLLQQIGYNSYTGGVGIGYSVSPRSVFTVTGTGSRFLPKSGGHDTNTYGVAAEWDLRQSQIARFYARAGVNRSEAQTAVGTLASNGVIGGVGVDLRYQITEITIDVLRALTPSEEGAVIIDDEVRFRVLHAFEPLLSGFLGARGMRLRGTSSNPALTIQGQDYAAAEAGVDYQITRNYRVEAKYDFTWQRFPGDPAAAHSDGVALSIIYQPLSRYEPLPEFTGIPRER